MVHNQCLKRPHGLPNFTMRSSELHCGCCMQKQLQADNVMMILAGLQGVFFNLYFFFYMLSPKHCHAFIGYLEEEAVKTCEPPNFYLAFHGRV